MIRLIETGGTLCMIPGPHGLVPQAGRVAAILPAGVACEAITPLIDSANVGPLLWNQLLDRIAAAKGPVIVTHGTDTMAYTGAALDAALAGTGASVVLTGAMQPLGTKGGDAEANLSLALDVAGRPYPGLRLAFAGKVMPAGRITKQHSTAAHAFRRAGDPAPATPPPSRRFADRKLAVLTLTPGMPSDMLLAALSTLDGAVLRVFGSGTAPAVPGLADALATAVANGCRIWAISQCASGGLMPGTYAAGAALWQAGVENAGMLSAEQALTRLWLALSVPELP
ncbi:MAG: asparaginase domain-containing protein [bacterium]